MEIGLQVFSVRSSFIRDRAGTMRWIAGAGYRNVEMPLDFSGMDLFGIGELGADELKMIVADAGLQLVATHILVTDDSQLDRVVSFHETLGCRRAVIPIAFFKSEADVLAFADKCNRYGERLGQIGVQLYYHNHFHEFQQFNGTTAYDLLLGNTDPNLLKFELDTYWALRAGMDVPALMDRLGDRCGLLHQKDLPAAVTPVNVFHTIDEREEIGIETIQRFGGSDQFVEIGEGTMDVRSIVRDARKLGSVEYVMVEQDATHRDELDSIAISFRALSGIMAS